MTLVLRREKGIPLTSDELDGNFEEFELRVEALEEIPWQDKSNHLAIYREVLPDKGTSGEIALFEKAGVLALVFYGNEAWHLASTGEVVR